MIKDQAWSFDADVGNDKWKIDHKTDHHYCDKEETQHYRATAEPFLGSNIGIDEINSNQTGEKIIQTKMSQKESKSYLTY